METSEAFISDLTELNSVLQSLLSEHLDDNFGELLPHVFLGEVMRHLVELGGKNETPDYHLVAQVLAYIEGRFGQGNSAIDELISTGFLENLPDPGDPGQHVRRALGPRLAAEAERVLGPETT